MFSGIGGFEVVLKLLASECVGHCEIDKHAKKQYNAIYNPQGEYYCDDARTINPKPCRTLIFYAQAFCQAFSVAGRRLDSVICEELIFEVARIVKEKRYPLLLLENVPGLLSHDGGRTVKTIFSVFTEMGYDIEWCVHNSRHFGVPSNGEGCILSDFLNQDVPDKYFLALGNAKDLIQIIPGPQGQRVYEADGIACTQCASSGGWGGKTGLYFIDMNADPVITEDARCITARQDSGVSNRRGEHSAVLIEDAPRAILTPDRETVRQKADESKNPTSRCSPSPHRTGTVCGTEVVSAD